MGSRIAKQKNERLKRVFSFRYFRSGYRIETNKALIFFVTFLYQDKKVKEEKIQL